MNVYSEFFKKISHEDWEHFAYDFLLSLGYIGCIAPARGQDAGRDALVMKNDKKLMVSCKHFITSNKSVGIKDEQSISDRILQHQANGFIGFYSTTITSNLQNRFGDLERQGHVFTYFDIHKITDHLPYISSYILQKYGSPKNIGFIFNVDESEYYPLGCMKCGKDILADENIPRSMASIAINDKNRLEYIYGCKICVNYISDMGWTEISQALHQEQKLIWNSIIREKLRLHRPAVNFFKNKSIFDDALLQRAYPSNWGSWLGY